VFDDLHQFRALAFDPVIHGVEERETGAAHLAQHLQLQFGIDVAQHHEVRLAELLGDFRLEGGEGIELGFEGVGLGHVVLVVAAPPECFAVGNHFHAAGVDFARTKEVKMTGRKIAANHAHDSRGGEVRGRHRRIGATSAEGALHFSEGCAHIIEGEAAHYQDCHRKKPFKTIELWPNRSDCAPGGGGCQPLMGQNL
jgi:hypothetical protein